MATLVFSTVGTMLGGPVGGTIGSLIGQSFDQQMFGGGLRRGPRIGDLAVQTSTYGTAVPRIYGRMRVAGSVIWATDLKESSTLIGAKGQPQSEVYSYSVSMAVALSSRRARSIRRIWADGKLLRGAAGDFKVSTKFRFHDGSEDQALDPLIASVEGIAMTPAYRGLALAVFEDLELAEYGNRIPFLTFEVEGDVGEIAVGDLLADASNSIIAGVSAEAVKGYAAHGPNLRAAIGPLIDCFGIDLVDDGGVLRAVHPDGHLKIGEAELGCTTGGPQSPSMERSIASADDTPTSVSIIYYDPERDYQTGQKRASIASGGPEMQMEAPMVLKAPEARAIAETMLARRWARREHLSIRLSAKHLGSKPGSRVKIGNDPKLWTIERCTLEAMAVRLDLRGTGETATDVPGDAGRATNSHDVVASPTSVAVFDLPLPDAGEGAIQVAAATASPGWRRVGLQVDLGDDPMLTASAPLQTVMGHALDRLAAGQPWLLDLTGTVDVQLVDHGDWLTSCDDQALLNGANLAVLGSELFQFGSAEPLGSARFRLTRLLRGRRGTEWASGGHAVGDVFALLAPSSFRTVTLPAHAQGKDVGVTPLGLADGQASAAIIRFTGEAVRPPSPVHLRASIESDGSLAVSWVRRSRSGWEWRNEVDAPLGEFLERYRVTIGRTGGAAEFECDSPQFSLGGAKLLELGDGDIVVTVRHVGDRALSRPAMCTIMVE